MKLYITNHAAGTENKQCLASINSEIYAINAKNSKKDRNTGILEIPTISADVPLNKTINLPRQLKVCLGARVMITTNTDTAGKLIKSFAYASYVPKTVRSRYYSCYIR